MTVLAVLPILGWGVIVGVVFSTIGAAGGILTAFGLMSLFGVVDPNAVKPMTQMVVLAATITFVPSYLRRSSLVLPLGLLLGAGGVFGAYVGSTVSSHYLTEMGTFQPLFGLLTLAIAAQLFWKLHRNRHRSSDAAFRMSQVQDRKVSELSVSRGAVAFSFAGQDFRVPVWSPILAGAAIAMTAAVFGVGGGFLLVPYMAGILAMPMHIIPATAAVSIFISLIVSVSNFVALGAPLDFGLLVPLTVGVVIGSVAGPFINRASRNSWLEFAMAVIVAGIGLTYTLR